MSKLLIENAQRNVDHLISSGRVKWDTDAVNKVVFTLVELYLKAKIHGPICDENEIFCILEQIVGHRRV